jgi:hypothetical protein
MAFRVRVDGSGPCHVSDGHASFRQLLYDPFQVLIFSVTSHRYDQVLLVDICV